MKSIKHLLLVTIYMMGSFSQVSCQRQPSKLSYDHPYDLTRIDFNMDVPKFMSGSIVMKEAIIDDKNYKDDLSMLPGAKMYHHCNWVNNKISDERHYINDDGKFIIEKAKYEKWGIEYFQGVATLGNPLATFHSIGFHWFHAVTNLQDQLEAIAVKGEGLNIEDIKKTILFCDENYEKIPADKKGLFRWETSDFGYLMVVENAPNNAFRFMATKDSDGKIIDIEQLPRDSKIYTNVTFFIFKKEAEKAIQQIQSGDFVKFPVRRYHIN